MRRDAKHIMPEIENAPLRRQGVFDDATWFIAGLAAPSQCEDDLERHSPRIASLKTTKSGSRFIGLPCQDRIHLRGSHPTRVCRLLLGRHRNATLKPTGEVVRGPHQGKAAKGGVGVKPTGKRLAHDTGHRADTERERRAFPCTPGGRTRVAAIA